MELRKIFSLSLAACLLASSLALTGCEKKTTTHSLAIFTAQADAALVALTEATALLHKNGKASSAAAKNVYTLNLRIAGSIDILRERAKTGFDKKDTLTIVDNVIADIRAAEAAGVINLTGETKTRFLQVTFFAQFTLRSIRAIIEASTPPAPPEAVAREVMSARAAGDETVWTDLVLVLQTAVLRGFSQSRMTQQQAFDDGALLSGELKASLSKKLSEL